MNLKALAAQVPLPTRINGTDRLVAPRMYRRYEPDAWQPFLDHIRPGDTLVDVGANVGLYAIAAARRGANVVAVEPDHRNAATLRRYARLNRCTIRTVEAVCGNNDGTALLAERGSPVSGTIDLYLGPTTNYTVVPSIRLDSLLAREPCDLLKIDVEGAELAVIQGGETTLARTRVVFLELHRPELARGGLSADLVLELVNASGLHGVQLPADDGPERWLFVR